MTYLMTFENGVRQDSAISPKQEYMIREHPFNLKGGGGLRFYWRKKNSVGKFDVEKNSVSEMDRKKYSINTLTCLIFTLSL